MLYFLYCLSKALATPRKNPNDPHGGRDPQVKNHWTRQAKNESIYISQIQTNSGKNQFNMQEQYCEIKYLIPLNLFLLLLSKKNIKSK